VGARDLAKELFRHDAPTPHEIEQAIDRVEDALAESKFRHPRARARKTCRRKTSA